MNRRFFLSVCGGALVSAVPAFARSFEDTVVKQLKSQGFKKIAVERTLLGRVRITAQSKAGWREIVLNPRTGEVLRDVLTAADGSTAPVIGNTSGSGGSGNSSNGQGGSDDNGSNSGGSDDGGSDDNGSDSGGSDDSGSDDNGSNSGGSDSGGSDNDASESKDDGEDD